MSAIPSPVEPMSDDSSLENVSTSEPHGEVAKASELDPPPSASCAVSKFINN